MKKVLSFAIAAALVSPLAGLAQGGLKIGPVDLQRAVREYSKTKEAEAKLNGVPVLMYARENTDFTSDVVTELNKPSRVGTSSAERPTTASSPSPRKVTPLPRP